MSKVSTSVTLDRKPKFLTPLRDEKIGPERWRLTDPLVFETDVLGEWWQFCAPEGFETDYASVPQIAQFLVSKVGPWDEGAVIHDWIYKHGLGLTREQADLVFLSAMESKGVSKFKRFLIYRSVRIGAGGVWKRHRKVLK